MTTDLAQAIFLDTPGIHRSDSSINKRMMDAVRASLEERDLLVFMIDVTKPFGENDIKAMSILHKDGPPVIAVFNKIDALKSKNDILPLLEEYPKHYDFAEYLPVSAATGIGMDELRL